MNTGSIFLTKFTGKPGEAGLPGFDGPAGGRGIPGVVIPVRYENFIGQMISQTRFFLFISG